MDIQEFSRQLGREEHSSQLIQALQAVRSLDAADLPKGGWGEWPPVEAAAPTSCRAEVPKRGQAAAGRLPS